MSWKRALVLGLLGVFVSVAPAAAQRVEVSGIFGWSLSDGVTFDPAVFSPATGNLYNEVDVKDSFSWGFSVGVLTSEQVEVGFLYNQQMSQLLVKGAGATGEVESVVGDMNVSNYHGYVAFNFGEADATVRPYILIGFGATNYPLPGFNVGGVQIEDRGITQFSTTWAPASRRTRRRISACARESSGRRPTSSRTPRAIGATRGGDATWSVMRNTRISCSSTAA
jgi:hypothetical protein